MPAYSINVFSPIYTNQPILNVYRYRFTDITFHTAEHLTGITLAMIPPLLFRTSLADNTIVEFEPTG